MELNRFVEAQEGVYQTALGEIQNGKKLTHWMWFIFPQIDGLGSSPTARRFAIKDSNEALEYLNHTVLGHRLCECTHALLEIHNKSAIEIFGHPDNLKLHSSLTLFSHIAKDTDIFSMALDRYFSGDCDQQTIKILDSR